MATEKINGVWHVSNKTSGGGGGGGTDPNAVHFTQQSLTAEQQTQARTNIGAGTYSKPTNGIPASDMETGAIPSVPVQDVTVGGTSVVSNGTAVIPAIPDAVEANPTVPSGTTPTDLTGLKVGNGYYSVPQGGGSGPNAQKTYDSEPSGGLKEGDIYASQGFVSRNNDLVNSGEEGWGSAIMFGLNGIGGQTVSVYDGSTLILTAEGMDYPPDAILYINLYNAGGELISHIGGDRLMYEYEVQEGITVTSATSNGILEVMTGDVAPVYYEMINGDTYERRPVFDNYVSYDDQYLTAGQKAQARNNIGAMGVNGAQKVIPAGDGTEASEGDIYYERETIVESTELVNTLSSDYLSYQYLKVSFVAEPAGNDDEVVTIHDVDANKDIFRIHVYDDGEGAIYAEIYDEDDNYYDYLEPGNTAVIDLDNYAADALTITSTESTSDISIHEVHYIDIPYEMFGGQGYLRQPVETISNKVTSLSAQSTDTQYPSAKAVYDEVNPPLGTTQPAGGFLPGKVYDLGTLTGTVTFALATPTNANVANPYHWTFETGGTAPTVSWPSGVIWPDGVTPSVEAGKHYEILIRKGYGTIQTFTVPSA